jgi:uncharacterized lipoprotein YajG
MKKLVVLVFSLMLGACGMQNGPIVVENPASSELNR